MSGSPTSRSGASRAPALPVTLLALLTLVAPATAEPAELRLAGGDTVELALPAGTDVHSTAGDASHWLAAGTRSTADGRELVLLASGPSGTSPLPSPSRGAPLAAEPAWLEHDGAVTGLAWLEGDDRGTLAVRFAGWTGAGWEPAETVAAPGPGSQLALATASLGDGTPLLAWSRFDGEDDEIYWSIRRGSRWSEPASLAAGNRVPDVTPALVAVPGGALAAWSRYGDGSYRVVASRFDGETWSEPAAVGPPGSLYPSFEAAPAEAASGPALLYRTARPRGWEAVELAFDGRPLRRARSVGTPAATPQRPRLATDDSGAPVLAWSDRRVALSWEIEP